MQTIIFGKDAEYLRDGLAARPGGHLILKDGTRYTFDVIEIPWNLDAPDRNNNLIEVQRLAYGAGKWMLSTESLFESLEKIQFDAWNKLDEIRSGKQLPRISRRDFQAVVLESPTLCFLQRSPPEMEIVRQINSEFFDPSYSRRWGLAQLLRLEQNAAIQREVCAAAWFEGNVTPLLLRDFSESSAKDGNSSSRNQEANLEPPDVNAALIWHVEQKIRDELDPRRKAAPSHAEVFVRYCRDRMKLADMKKKFCWKDRTLKARKAALKDFLQKHFRLKLEHFFLDRRIFAAAERQLNEDRAKRISRRDLGECDLDQDDELSR